MGNRFTAIENYITEDKRLNIYDLAAYQAVKYFCGHRSHCWPSAKKLAEIARCSRARVFTSLSKLEHLGYLAREPQIGGTTVYRICPMASSCDFIHENLESQKCPEPVQNLIYSIDTGIQDIRDIDSPACGNDGGGLCQHIGSVHGMDEAVQNMDGVDGFPVHDNDGERPCCGQGVSTAAYGGCPRRGHRTRYKEPDTITRYKNTPPKSPHGGAGAENLFADAPALPSETNGPRSQVRAEQTQPPKADVEKAMPAATESAKNGKNEVKAAALELFEEFWQTYPGLKEGREGARRMFCRRFLALPDKDARNRGLDLLNRQLYELYLRVESGTDPRYLPRPKNFLRDVDLAG